MIFWVVIVFARCNILCVLAGWACGIHVLMHLEHLANGNEPVDNVKTWTDEQVYKTDERYTAILNGERFEEVPIYNSPSAFERKCGFCAKLDLKDRLTRELVASVQKRAFGGANDWVLLRCPRISLENRDYLVQKHILIEWETSGVWFIARVTGVEGRCHTINFLRDDQPGKIRLVGYGFDAPPNGNGVNWCHVARNSAIIPGPS